LVIAFLGRIVLYHVKGSRTSGTRMALSARLSKPSRDGSRSNGSRTMVRPHWRNG